MRAVAFNRSAYVATTLAMTKLRTHNYYYVHPIVRWFAHAQILIRQLSPVFVVQVPLTSFLHPQGYSPSQGCYLEAKVLVCIGKKASKLLNLLKLEH